MTTHATIDNGQAAQQDPTITKGLERVKPSKPKGKKKPAKKQPQVMTSAEFKAKSAAPATKPKAPSNKKLSFEKQRQRLEGDLIEECHQLVDVAVRNFHAIPDVMREQFARVIGVRAELDVVQGIKPML